MNNPPPRYVLHPDYVTSAWDLDQHWISGPELARLYGVYLKDCVYSGILYQPRVTDIHLHPKTNGDYTLPEIEND